MPEVKENTNKKLETPTIEPAKEAAETELFRVKEELTQLRLIAEKALNENQILRATVKALTQLI